MACASTLHKCHSWYMECFVQRYFSKRHKNALQTGRCLLEWHLCKRETRRHSKTKSTFYSLHTSVFVSLIDRLGKCQKWSKNHLWNCQKFWDSYPKHHKAHLKDILWLLCNKKFLRGYFLLQVKTHVHRITCIQMEALFLEKKFKRGNSSWDCSTQE